MAAITHSTQQEKQCTLLLNFDQKPNFTKKEIKEILEDQTPNADEERKIEAMKTLLLLHLNGTEDMTALLMSIIRFVLPSTNKILKKLALYYLESVNRKDNVKGGMRGEMLMACSHLRNDLLHPNEYVRGFTLRFLSKVKENELLEPLIQPILENLQHRTSYVRRCAVTTIFSIYSNAENGEELIPDAPELMEEFLKTETEISAMRHAFIMLFHCDQERAVRYLRSNFNTISTQGDIFQLSILNLLKQMCKLYPSEKGTYLKVISSLLESKSSAVVYQCCTTLVSLSTSPISIKYASTHFIKLLQHHPDNSVKLIILERLIELKNKFKNVMQYVVMDLLRTLSTNPEMEIRKKVLQISIDLITTQNVENVLQHLRKELIKSKSETIEYEKLQEQEYRKLLMKTIHCCIKKYPLQTSHFILLFIEFLNDACGVECAILLREMMEIVNVKNVTQSTDILQNNLQNTLQNNTQNRQVNIVKLRQDILQSILKEHFTKISSARVFRIILWMIGDYCNTIPLIRTALNTIKEECKDLLIYNQQPVNLTDLESVDNYGDNESTMSDTRSTTTINTTITKSGSVNTNISTNKNVGSGGTMLRQDGTYVTQFAESQDGNGIGGGMVGGMTGISGGNTYLKTLIEERNFYLASVVANTLCKLTLRLHDLLEEHLSVNNKSNDKKKKEEEEENVVLSNEEEEDEEEISQKEVNRYTAECMNLMISFIRIGLTKPVVVSNSATVSGHHDGKKKHSHGHSSTKNSGFIKMDKDTLERIHLCIKLLSTKNGKLNIENKEVQYIKESTNLENYRIAYLNILKEQLEMEKAEELKQLQRDGGDHVTKLQCDALIHIPQLRGKTYDAFDFEEEDLSRALTNEESSVKNNKSGNGGNKLNRVTQLTGFSDTVYAEAKVVTHQFDILLDVLVVNTTTNQTFQNLTLEMATVGDLKLCERPQTYTLGPLQRQHITANIKVSSTENGIIFGNIVYDTPKGESFCIILNDIHINIMDYIQPAICNDIQFRSMWFEFEWENKIAVRSLTTNVSLLEYLDFLKTITKTNCLTPQSALEGECEFLSANLYAKSTFGEDALANVSIEKLEDGTIEGVVRIRSKTQGIALSLGNVIGDETKKFDEKRLK
ncbi:hypothetical protein ABK040_013087 [Willaertia magna]